MENKDGGVPGTGAPAAAAAEVPPAVEVREQDQLMPITNVNRIMRRVLPPHAKISDDAKELVQECTSEFISFLTGEANEQCHKECRKTISAHDILWALRSLGFNDYIQPVTAYLNRMRDIENGVVVVNPLPAGPRPPPLPPSAAGSSQGLMQQMQMQMLMQMQMQLGGAMYAPRPPAPVQQQHYAIPAMPMRVRPPFVGGQQGAVFRGNQPMAPYYGGEHLAYGEGSSRGAGDVGDEGSSSN